MIMFLHSNNHNRQKSQDWKNNEIKGICCESMSEPCFSNINCPNCEELANKSKTSDPS